MSKHVEKYEKKYAPELMGQKFATVKDLAVAGERQAHVDQASLRSRVYAAIQSKVSSPTTLLAYFYLAEEAHRLRRQFSGNPLTLECALIRLKWKMRGLDSDLVNAALGAAGIQVDTLPNITATIISDLKTMTITMQSPKETLLGTPETLPTSEPSFAQVGYTVASGDLPVFSLSPYSKKWTAYVIGAGKTVTATTISCRLKKNGNSVATGSGAVAANTYFTMESWFYDIVVGDLLEMALWSNKTDSVYDYKAYLIQVTRIVPSSDMPSYFPLNIVTLSPFPVLTSGNPTAAYTGYWALYFDDSMYAQDNITTTLSAYRGGTTYGLGRLINGDLNLPNAPYLRTHATYRPFYSQNRIPVSLSWKELST